jgi:nucleotidyltransferase/DNA polymerase involved in DNA repair
VIAHVDMDAFFVSVELLRRPELRGQPVIVATGDDPRARGVVMAASYEARRFGVHSALPLTVAHRRCPQAVLVPSDIALYRRTSRQVMEILAAYSDRFEVAGLDEAYLDLSGSMVPRARARGLKREVRERTGLGCSVGLAENKLLAKIASDLEKPDGLCVLRAADMLAAVGERPATLIPGVGPRTAERLDGAGIRTVAELAHADEHLLGRVLGPSRGVELRERANGIDRRPLATERRRKSESRETTFAADVSERRLLASTLDRLARSVCEGLEAERLMGRTVTMKIRLRPFRTYTRSRTLDAPTADGRLVSEVARELLERFAPSAPVRLIGVGVSGLSPVPARESGPATAAGDDGAEPLAAGAGMPRRGTHPRTPGAADAEVTSEDMPRLC